MSLEEDIKHLKSSCFGKMAMFLSGSPSPTQLQKMITPGKIVPFTAEKVGSTPQVMLDCVNGRRLPSKKSQAEIYIAFPELRPWINMPIWDVLLNDQIDSAEFEILLFKIKNNVVLKSILSNNYETYGLDIRSKRLNKTIENLKHDGSFDALSALTLLLVKAESIKKTTYKHLIKEAITNVLLVISLRYCLEEEIQILYRLYRDRFSFRWVDDICTNSVNQNKIVAEGINELWYETDPKLSYYWYSSFVLYRSAIELGFSEDKRKLSMLISKFHDLGNHKLYSEFDYNKLVYPDYYENIFQLIIEHFKVGREDEAILRKEYFHLECD